MDSPCRGAPRQGLMARTSGEFPDLRVQYPCITLTGSNSMVPRCEKKPLPEPMGETDEATQ